LKDRIRIRTRIEKRRSEIETKRKANKQDNNLQPGISAFLFLSRPKRTSLQRFFIANDFGVESVLINIQCPKEFSLTDKLEPSLVFIKKVFSCLINSNKDFVLDFSKCKKIDLGALMVLEIMVQDYQQFQEKFNSSYYYKVNKGISSKPSTVWEVNRILFALGFITHIPAEKPVKAEYLHLSLLTTSKAKSDVRENRKGWICTKIRDFVDMSLKASNVKLNSDSRNSLDNLMGEILNNAEDHSELNNFYVDGVSFKEYDDEGKTIIELNLAIVNFGFSIYEGLEGTKEQNSRIYGFLNDLYNTHEDQFTKRKSFSKESLFTLYALQEGVSRFKFERKSRGTGTMSFIRAFISLGSLGTESPEHLSKLNILSGKANVKCDNVFAPFPTGAGERVRHRLSLNKEKDLKILPDQNYLVTNESSFPGTLLQVKIFMSEDHFDKVLEKN